MVRYQPGAAAGVVDKRLVAGPRVYVLWLPAARRTDAARWSGSGARSPISPRQAARRASSRSASLAPGASSTPSNPIPPEGSPPDSDVLTSLTCPARSLQHQQAVGADDGPLAHSSAGSGS